MFSTTAFAYQKLPVAFSGQVRYLNNCRYHIPLTDFQNYTQCNFSFCWENKLCSTLLWFISVIDMYIMCTFIWCYCVVIDVTNIHKEIYMYTYLYTIYIYIREYSRRPTDWYCLIKSVRIDNQTSHHSAVVAIKKDKPVFHLRHWSLFTDTRKRSME